MREPWAWAWAVNNGPDGLTSTMALLEAGVENLKRPQTLASAVGLRMLAFHVAP